MKILSIVSLFFLFSFSNAPADNWDLAYKGNGITVYTRTLANGLTEFKGITEINAEAEQIAALLEDVSQHKSFVYGVKEGAVIDEINGNEKIVYSEIEMPWPLSNRDIVSKTKSVYNHETKTIVIETFATPDKIANKEGLERIEKAEGYWKLTEIAKEKTEVTYQFVSDPGGLPNWVVSMFIVDAPKKTLLALKNLEATLQKSTKDLDWVD